MSNEFDDELGRGSGPKGRSRARKSEYGTSDEGYYLDDDFDTPDYEDRDAEVRGRQVNSGDGTGSAGPRRPAGGDMGQPGNGGARGARRSAESGQPGSGGARGTGRSAESGQSGSGDMRGNGRSAESGKPGSGGTRGPGRAPENGQTRNSGVRGTGRPSENSQPGTGGMRGAGRSSENGQPGTGSMRGAGRAAENGQPGTGGMRGAGRPAENGQPGTGGMRGAGKQTESGRAVNGGSRGAEIGSENGRPGTGSVRGTGRTLENGQSGTGSVRGTGRQTENGRAANSAESGQGSRRQAAGGSGNEPRRRPSQDPSIQIGDNGNTMNGAGGRRGQEPGGRMAASRSAAQAAKKKKIRRIITMAVLEVITLICIGFYGYALRLNSAVNRPAFDQDKVKNVELSAEQTEHMKGYWPIAVFGVDSRDGNVHTGTNADVIMICNINRDTGEIKLVSVFRDTYLNISEKGTYNKINAAYANGGAEQALAAINRNLDLDIQDYVTFNWKAVADGINMLGGIDGIDISKAEFRYINSFITETVEKTGVPSVHLKSAGAQHLDGVQAVAYGRLRLMDTDYARTERQRLVIEKAFEKAKKADLGLLNRILLMEVDQVETSLSFSDFTDLILDIGKYHIGETGGFPFARDAMIMGKKGDCVIPQTLESNVVELHKFLYDKDNYDPTSLVKKISAKIAADSGMYKQGKSVGHVPTDEGYIPKETEETKKPTQETDEVMTSESTSEGESIEETDENGDPIKPTKPGETTADGTKPTKPGETTADGTKPTKPGETTADGTKPTKPGETTADGMKPTGPGETTADGTKPTGPEGNGTNPTRPSVPGGDEPSGPADSTTGPGVKPTTPHESTSAPETTASQGPGGSDGPGGGAVTPGGSGSGEPITVPPMID